MHAPFIYPRRLWSDLSRDAGLTKLLVEVASHLGMATKFYRWLPQRQTLRLPLSRLNLIGKTAK